MKSGEEARSEIKEKIENIEKWKKEYDSVEKEKRNELEISKKLDT